MASKFFIRYILMVVIFSVGTWLFAYTTLPGKMAEGAGALRRYATFKFDPSTRLNSLKNTHDLVHSDGAMRVPNESKSSIRSDNIAEELASMIGEGRLVELRRACRMTGERFELDVDAILKLSPSHRPRFYFSDNYQFILCEVPKCGSTDWKKALLAMEGIANYEDRAKIGKPEAHFLGQYLYLWDFYNESNPRSVALTKQRISTYTRIITVREPLQRIVSAYKDKMLPTGTGGSLFAEISKRIHEFYSDSVTANQATNGSHASWKEFVRYLLDKNREVFYDSHWKPISEMCYPCISAYDYVAKLETMHQDAKLISRLLQFDITPFFPASGGGFRHETWSTEYRNYFEELPIVEREKLYDVYALQYLLFGYPKPTFL